MPAHRKANHRKPIDRKLPGTSTGGSANRMFASLAEEQLGANGFAGKSLLRSICGSVRIPPPRNCLLAEIVKRRQATYAAILGRIMSGCSLVAASVAVGLSRSTVRNWLVDGLRDQANNADTYYARFASDIHAALAHSVGEAELAVMRRNPIEYLRSGPGRAFYQDREAYWQEIDASKTQLPPSDIEPLAEFGPSPQESLVASRASAALDALRELNIIQAPEFEKQLANNEGIVNTTPVVDPRTVVEAGPVGPTSVQPISIHPNTRGH